jgi:glycosyltransferase involved in cell wall biosynthesis
MDPLISIITPFYNASSTLPYALRSLLNQTYQNWECILVDDGSEDDPQAIIDKFQDPRFSYHRLDKNQGRGAARQVALEQTQGDYVCFLDADDWIYPHKLQVQLEAMKKHPELDLISSGMAVVDARNELIGVRGFSERGRSILKFERMAKASPLKVSFAPAMIRMNAAQEAAFDPNLRRSEDADYLIQILTRHKYGALTDVNYVYRFMSFEKVDLLAGYISRIQVLKKYRESNPTYISMQIFRTRLVMLIYRMAFGIGLGKELIKNRYRRPTEYEREEYVNMLKQLNTISLKDHED